MHVFYTPDIQKTNELPEEEAQHCTRVLRLSIGDEITTSPWHQLKIWTVMNGLPRKPLK